MPGGRRSYSVGPNRSGSTAIPHDQARLTSSGLGRGTGVDAWIARKVRQKALRKREEEEARANLIAKGILPSG